MTVLGRSPGAKTLPVPGRPEQTVRLEWGASTDIGRRRHHNEDSYLAESPFFVVADGMGGHAAGDVASAAVVTRLAASAYDDVVQPADIMDALRTATDDISHAADADDLGVGTTVTGVALTVQGGDPYWAVFNIGDSRVYRFDAGELEQITTDHSVVQELIDARLLDPRDAEFHPDSSVITRAVGFNVEPHADFWMLPLTPGLRMLVCSDGLTREVDDAGLRERLSGEGSPADIAESLVQDALAGGGRDNVTAVVVDVVELGADTEFGDIGSGDDRFGDDRFGDIGFGDIVPDDTVPRPGLGTV